MWDNGNWMRACGISVPELDKNVWDERFGQTVTRAACANVQSELRPKFWNSITEAIIEGFFLAAQRGKPVRSAFGLIDTRIVIATFTRKILVISEYCRIP